MRRKLVVICNALDDVTRVQRGIITDSPAASRKVFSMAHAVRYGGVRPFVLSLGRGRPDGSGRYFHGIARRTSGVAVVYLPFTHRRALSQALSLVLLPIFLMRLIARRGGSTVVFYNRSATYILALFVARALAARSVLDLEDGDVARGYQVQARATAWLLRSTFDNLCNGGALLACKSLSDATSLRPVTCFYGAVEPACRVQKAIPPVASVLFGGTISVDTGARLLIDAIRSMRRERTPWSEKIEFVVTGKGDCINALQALSQEQGVPRVTVKGRIGDGEYDRILANATIGLALKPNHGLLAQTTFPSKVVELANAGLLVITTRISDVPDVLGNGALYLADDHPEALVSLLRWAVENPVEAKTIAESGTKAVADACARPTVGRRLASFLFPRPEAV